MLRLAAERGPSARLVTHSAAWRKNWLMGGRRVVLRLRFKLVTDDVREHYVALWGEPSRTASYELLGHAIDVYKWDAVRSPEQVNLYATLGAALYSWPGHALTHRVEFFVGLEPAQDEVARALAMAALDPVINGTTLDHGHSITFAEPLWPGTAMHSMLVLRPVLEVVPVLVTKDRVHVGFMQMIPVYPAEVRFKEERQVDTLLQHWRSTNVAFWNPNRQPQSA